GRATQRERGRGARPARLRGLGFPWARAALGATGPGAGAAGHGHTGLGLTSPPNRRKPAHGGPSGTAWRNDDQLVTSSALRSIASPVFSIADCTSSPASLI